MKKELLKQVWKDVFGVDEVADDADFLTLFNDLRLDDLETTIQI